MRSETPSATRSELKSTRRLQLAAAVQTFKIFLKTEKLVLFCQINLNKSTAFSRPFGSNLGQVACLQKCIRFSRKESGTISGILRKLRLLRADCIFLCFLHCMQKKRRFCAAKMHSVEPQRFSRHVCPAKTKKPFLTE